MSRPRFTVSSDEKGEGVWVFDDDFGYDAMMKVTGDMNFDDKLLFALSVADVLNENHDRIPRRGK